MLFTCRGGPFASMPKLIGVALLWSIAVATFSGEANTTTSSHDDDDDNSTSTSPSPTTTFAPTYAGCRPRDDEKVVYYCPFERYCEWDYHTLERREELRGSIGYDSPQWNYNASSPTIEALSFDSLTDAQRDGLTGLLGFDEDRHDCCQNHYDDYDWSDLDPADGYGPVLKALGTLGYNEIMWQNDVAAAYDRFGWDNLPDDVRWAAEEMCYTRETWDGADLRDWPPGADLPGAYWREDADATNGDNNGSSKRQRNQTTGGADENGLSSSSSSSRLSIATIAAAGGLLIASLSSSV